MCADGALPSHTHHQLTHHHTRSIHCDQHKHTNATQVNPELEREAKEKYAETLAAGQQRK